LAGAPASAMADAQAKAYNNPRRWRAEFCIFTNNPAALLEQRHSTIEHKFILWTSNPGAELPMSSPAAAPNRVGLAEQQPHRKAHQQSHHRHPRLRGSPSRRGRSCPAGRTLQSHPNPGLNGK
jgi:hypothetical protein